MPCNSPFTLALVDAKILNEQDGRQRDTRHDGHGRDMSEENAVGDRYCEERAKRDQSIRIAVGNKDTLAVSLALSWSLTINPESAPINVPIKR